VKAIADKKDMNKRKLLTDNLGMSVGMKLPEIT
jgi:hypothetical protein